MDLPNDPFNRGKRSLAINLKNPEAQKSAARLIEKADILIEGYRPGAVERLALALEACHELNPQLIYEGMTGWGQSGPLMKTAGHDINYIALSGALAAMGPSSLPPPLPLNLVGDLVVAHSFSSGISPYSPNVTDIRAP